MTTPFLIADAAEVAIMSPLAEAAFGSYDLQVPDGIDIEDIHDFEAPGNGLGYVARLSPQRATGIARRFIRADVAVTAKDDTDPDVIPESDVDRVLSEAESRVESEFFLESVITKAGLGASVPYVNFNVGDIANVRIFDIWVKLPVTRIEPIISEGDVVDWRVHVGGQLLSDDQAREVENATIQKELIQDRRDLADIDAKATQAVKDSSEAKSTADQAKQVAQTANSAASQAQKSADGKSTIFYGDVAPAKAKAGDTWFKDVDGGGTVLMQYVNGKWVEKVNAKAIDDELAANQEALTELNNVTLPGLKEELEALDTEVAREAAAKLATLETKLANADKALKTDLVAQLGELESDLAALDTAVGENLTAKLAALRTELKQADTTVTSTLRGELSTLKTQLQNADAALKTDLVGQLNAARKALQNADQAVTNDLSKRLEDARKDLKAASDTIAKDLAEVDSAVSRQRPGNLFPDPFFADSSWTGAAHVAEDGIFKLKASGVQTGRYYQPSGLRDSSIQFERGASYLMTADIRFGATWGIDYVTVYARVPNADGTGIWTTRLGQLDRVSSGPGKNSYTWAPTSAILTLPENMASGTGTIGFFVESSHPDGDVGITNVRLHRAADNSLIIDGAVTAAKVKAGVIDADHIAAGAIVSTKLAADSVVAGKIAANAVTANSIAANQVTTGKIAAGAVTANEIESETILAKNIKAGQITTAKIAADAVTANEIAANAVTANAIKAGEVTTAKLAADAVTANKIAADQILAKHVKAGQITTAKLAADAVTANEIASNQILAKHIKSGQITTAKLAADAVTAKELAADAVSANKLLAEDATIDKLWANGLVAKSVLTNRVLVAGNGNMLPEIAAYAASSNRPDPDPYPRPFGVNTSIPAVWVTGNDNAVIEHPVNLVAGQKYRLSYGVHATVNGTRHFWGLLEGTADGVTTTSAQVKVRGTTSYYMISNEPANRALLTYEAEFEPLSTGTYYLRVFANHPNGTNNDNGHQWFRDLRLEKMTGTTLIEDGAVTTGKIATDAVTANSIKSGEITSNHISSSKISSDKITVKDGYIKNAMIDKAAVTNAKIANLDAGKITAGTIDANRIGAKTITGDHLAVDTIEANQIKANVFTQVASNVIPLYPGTTTPAWTINADASGTNATYITDGDPRWYRFDGTRQPGSDNLVEVDPDVEYVFSVWAFGATGSVLFVELRDQDGNHAVESGGITGYGEDDNSGVGYLIRQLSLLSGWRKITTKIKLKKETRFVRIGGIYGNHSSGANGGAHLADMRLYPDVASQTEVDARQDKAIAEMQKYVNQMMGTFYSQSAAYAKKFNELSEPMSGGLVAGQDEAGIMTTTSTTITCTPGWVGHILVHIMHKNYDGLNVQRHEVTGSSREFTIPSVSLVNQRPVAIHWFKRPGRAYATDMSRGAYAMPQGSWTTVSTATVGTGDWNLSATVGWDSANNHGAYGIRILVNGSEVERVAPRTGLGPLLPFGSGYRTQSLSASGNGNGRTTKFEIQAYISKGNASQRRIRRVNATLDWTKLN